MPIYCYTNGERVEEVLLPVGSAPSSININGETFRRSYHHETKPFHPENWPILSDALGVHPTQVQDAHKESIAAGVPTEFAPDGRAVLTSPAHRKRYAEALGYFDRNAGYNDPLPQNQ